MLPVDGQAVLQLYSEVGSAIAMAGQEVGAVPIVDWVVGEFDAVEAEVGQQSGGFLEVVDLLLPTVELVGVDAFEHGPSRRGRIIAVVTAARKFLVWERACPLVE